MFKCRVFKHTAINEQNVYKTSKTNKFYSCKYNSRTINYPQDPPNKMVHFVHSLYHKEQNEAEAGGRKGIQYIIGSLRCNVTCVKGKDYVTSASRYLALCTVHTSGTGGRGGVGLSVITHAGTHARTHHTNSRLANQACRDHQEGLRLLLL